MTKLWPPYWNAATVIFDHCDTSKKKLIYKTIIRRSPTIRRDSDLFSSIYEMKPNAAHFCFF